jgi:hypothetical protein
MSIEIAYQNRADCISKTDRVMFNYVLVLLYKSYMMYLMYPSQPRSSCYMRTIRLLGIRYCYSIAVSEAY